MSEILLKAKPLLIIYVYNKIENLPIYDGIRNLKVYCKNTQNIADINYGIKNFFKDLCICQLIYTFAVSFGNISKINTDVKDLSNYRKEGRCGQ